MTDTESFDSIPLSSEEEVEVFFNSVESEIIQTFDQLINTLMLRRDELLEQLRKLKDDYEHKVRLQNDEIEELIAMRDKLLEANPRDSLVQSSLTKMKCLDEVEFKLREINCPLLPPVPELCCDIDSLLAKFAELGTLADVRAMYSDKYQPYKSIGRRGQGKNEFNNPRGLFLDEKRDELYIVDAGNARVKILNASYFEVKQEFGRKHLVSPWGISVWEDSIFVTDEGLSQILKFSLPNYKLVSSFCCNTKHIFNDPRGICTNANGDTYVAYLTTNRIAVFTPELEVSKYIGEAELFHPQDVKFSTQTLFVLDESKQCIHLYNMSGHELYKILERGDNCAIFHAIFFYLDSFSNIFISDVHRNSIKIFSKSGLLIHDIEEAVNTTKGLVLSRSNQLITCSGSSHMIELY